jgi:hypothetical protein
MATSVTIRFRSNNDALVGQCARAEVTRILKDITEKLNVGHDTGVIHDINGNVVGRFDADIEEE